MNKPFTVAIGQALKKKKNLENLRNLDKGKGEQDEGLDIPGR